MKNNAKICSFAPDKVLLFRNIMGSSFEFGKNQEISCGTHYLASALQKERIPFILSNAAIRDSMGKDDFIRIKKSLKLILVENPEINFIVLTLSEFYFEQASALIEFLRNETKAFIGVGGVMPTLSPMHAFVHLPGVNFLVRGQGEEILPKIIQILSGKNRDSKLSLNEIRGLSLLEGFLFRSREHFIIKNVNHINTTDNFDNSVLDFSFFKNENFAEGIGLFTSWGCRNNCYFCTGIMKSRPLVKSVGNLKKIISDYSLELKKRFKSRIPRGAYNISFYDDDFLVNPQRSMDLFEYINNSGFKINFFQTGINSFFLHKRRNSLRILNERLIESIDPSIFVDNKDINIYIGLENICDEELLRLGKGYKSDDAEKVIRALAVRKIKVAYHFIASNQLTTLNNIIDNLIEFAVFQDEYAKYFNILTPIIPNLVSLYPSASYRNIVKEHRNNFLSIKKILVSKSYPKLDYPLVKNDIPQDRTVRRVVSLLSKLFNTENKYSEILRIVCQTYGLSLRNLSTKHRSANYLFLRY